MILILPYKQASNIRCIGSHGTRHEKKLMTKSAKKKLGNPFRKNVNTLGWKVRTRRLTSEANFSSLPVIWTEHTPLVFRGSNFKGRRFRCGSGSRRIRNFGQVASGSGIIISDPTFVTQKPVYFEHNKCNFRNK
jgi:hypothetical protein